MRPIEAANAEYVQLAIGEGEMDSTGDWAEGPFTPADTGDDPDTPSDKRGTDHPTERQGSGGFAA